MKNLLLIVSMCFFILSTYSQNTYRTKNRYYAIDMDTTIHGLWSSIGGIDGPDSLYINQTGIPDYGDLHIPDLELKCKSLWFGTKVYFLFRHLDDSLVTGMAYGMPDDSLKPGLENRDATALYFFLEDDSTRLESSSDYYINDKYLESVAWFRWVWGADDFEGVVRKDTISSIEDLGGEMKQWNDGRYSYTKLSVDIEEIASDYTFEDDVLLSDPDEDGNRDTLYKGPSVNHYTKFGFDVELNENDREEELLDDGLYGMQTRAFMGFDMDSMPLAPRNVQRWQWLYFTFSADKSSPTFIKQNSYSTKYARIYPNPASEYVTVAFEEYADADYKMFDLSGRLVKTGTLNDRENVLDIQGLNPGAYYLQIVNSKKEVIVSKVYKVR